MLMACGPGPSSTDAGAPTTPTWVSFLGQYAIDGTEFHTLGLDGRGRVVGLPKGRTSSVIWAEGHRIDTSTLTGQSPTVVSYLDARDRMMGFLSSGPNAAVFAKDQRGLTRWSPPPPVSALFPVAWSDDDRLLAQGPQRLNSGTLVTALVSWRFSDAQALPESARVGQLYSSERIVSANTSFDYVSRDISNVDVLPNKLFQNGAAVATETFEARQLLEDGTVWGRVKASDGLQTARWVGGVTSIVDPTDFLAASPAGDALAAGDGHALLVSRDGSKRALDVPFMKNAHYWLNDEGRVLLQDLLTGNTWLYTPRTLADPLGATNLLLSEINAKNLERAPLEVTSVTATATTQSLVIELLAAPSNVRPRAVTLQAQLGRAPVPGETWPVGARFVNGHAEQLIITYSEGAPSRVFVANGGSVELIELAGNVARLKLNAITFSEGDAPAFTLSGAVEVHSVNDP